MHRGDGRRDYQSHHQQGGSRGGGGGGGSGVGGGGSVTAIVAKHYNELQEKGVDARRESRIFHLRSFNNWIKSMLISDIVKRCKANGNDELVILDMCCGKGGDIQKWVKSNAASHVVFADIAETSVQQCQERYNNMHNGQSRGGWGGRNRRQNQFTAEFITADCTKEILREKYSDPNIKFDIVSVQFSFHYSFESIQQAQKMLLNISQNLAPGGYFIGTTPNANRIVKMMRIAKSKEFSNEVFRIKFETEEPFPIFGAKYYFQLDEVVNCPEFLVHFPVLEKLAANYGLKLVYKHPFDEFFSKMLNDGHFLLDRMNALQTYPPTDGGRLLSENEIEYLHAENFLQTNTNVKLVGTLSKSEWETVSLYIAFAFQKI